MTRRRDFVKTLALAGLGTMVWRCSSAQDGAGEKPAALVIGAGMAGLAAARQLSAEGWQVTVLEGRKRLGGRIWTNRDLGFPVDMGASWIHGTRGNPISGLAGEFGLDTLPTDYDDIQVHGLSGKPLGEEALSALDRDVNGLFAEAEKVVYERGTDMSLGRAIDTVLAREKVSPQLLARINWALAELENASAAALDDLSLTYLDAGDGFSGGDRLFPGGYDQIPKGLAQGLDIRYGQKVHTIHHSPAGVKVDTDQGSFAADGVIVTVPLGVLQKKVIRFEPALPEWKTRAIGKLHMGALNKLVFTFPEVFWPKERTFFGNIRKTRGEFPGILNLYPVCGRPALMFFTSGDFGRTLESVSNGEIEDHVMVTLRRMFGGSIPNMVDGIRARWYADPFAYGSYSHIPPGATPKDYEALAEPVGERLLFAGEATHKDYFATVHGAYLSGLREAKRALAL